jgi:hypothetical protein
MKGDIVVAAGSTGWLDMHTYMYIHVYDFKKKISNVNTLI